MRMRMLMRLLMRLRVRLLLHTCDPRLGGVAGTSLAQTVLGALLLLHCTDARSFRLADAVALAECEQAEWLERGHPHLRCRVRRFFDTAVSDGTITRWLPAAQGEPALWHMTHEDGDQEDLEAHEVRAAMRAYKLGLQHDAGADGEGASAMEDEDEELYSATDTAGACKRRRRHRWTGEEDAHIIAEKGLGKTYDQISHGLPGRTARAVKKRWSCLKDSALKAASNRWAMCISDLERFAHILAVAAAPAEGTPAAADAAADATETTETAATDGVPPPPVAVPLVELALPKAFATQLSGGTVGGKGRWDAAPAEGMPAAADAAADATETTETEPPPVAVPLVELALPEAFATQLGGGTVGGKGRWDRPHRVGLIYACKHCGQPKKGHECTLIAQAQWESLKREEEVRAQEKKAQEKKDKSQESLKREEKKKAQAQELLKLKREEKKKAQAQELLKREEEVRARVEKKKAQAQAQEQAQLVQHILNSAMMRACAAVRAERERERLQIRSNMMARIEQEELDAARSQIPFVEVEPMLEAEEAAASAFHAVLGGDIAQGKELRAASAGTLYRGARSTAFRKQADQHQKPATIACGEQRETFEVCAHDGLVTTKGCPFNMGTWVPLPYGSEALFSQIYFVPVEVEVPPQFAAQPTALVRIAKGDRILKTCEPFFSSIRAHGDKIGMDAAELERIVSYCAAQCLVACATLHTPSRPDHLPRKVLAVEAYGGEGDAAEGKRHLDAKKTAAYQRMPAGQVYFQAYYNGMRWGLSIRLGGPGQLLLRALAPEDERVPLHKAPYEGLDSTALRSAALLGMRHLLTTKNAREFHVHSNVLNITSDKRLRLVLSPPAQCHPTAAPVAPVMSAQRLNSDTTQTSAASPLLPDGTERGRTPPLPQPPEPPMQPLQPPTLMQLPPPAQPPSAAAAPPVPEAPRMLSAKALGKRKIGSW